MPKLNKSTSVNMITGTMSESFQNLNLKTRFLSWAKTAQVLKHCESLRLYLVQLTEASCTETAPTYGPSHILQREMLKKMQGVKDSCTQLSQRLTHLLPLLQSLETLTHHKDKKTTRSSFIQTTRCHWLQWDEQTVGSCTSQRSIKWTSKIFTETHSYFALHYYSGFTHSD